MIGSATGDNIDLINIAQELRVPLQLREDNTAAVAGNSFSVVLWRANLLDKAAHGVSNRLGLLVDFFKHEVLIAALLCRFSIPTDIENLLINRLTFAIGDCYGIFLDDCNFTIIEDIGWARPVDDRRNIWGNEVFALTKTDNKRIILLGANQFFRVILRHEDERVRAFNSLQYLTNSDSKVAVVQFFQQVSDYLCIGFWSEGMTFGD